MEIKKIADLVYDAYENKTDILSFTDDIDGMNIDKAYQVQLYNVDRILINDKVVGKKVGLTSKEIQKKLNVSSPDFGHLFESKNILSNEIDISQFSNPRIEAEIAFVIKKDIDFSINSDQEIIDSIDYVVASFEIADSRIRDWQFNLNDTICDNAAFGAFKLGTNKIKIADIDLENEKVEMFINDKLVNTGIGSNCLESPFLSLKWLIVELKKYKLNLKRHDIVLSGALSGATPVKKGDYVKAKFSNLGEIEIKFK